MTDGNPTAGADEDFDIWVEFNDIGPDGTVTATADFEQRRELDTRRPGGVHIGTEITAGDHEGNRCPATVTGFGPDYVTLRLDFDNFHSGGS